MANNSVKRLRDNLLGKKAPIKSSTVEIDGEKYEVREFTLGDRNALVRKVTDKDGNIDYSGLQVWTVIYSVHDPETGERIFEDSDYPQLLKQPASSSFVDKFLEAAGGLGGTEGNVDTTTSEPTTD